MKKADIIIGCLLIGVGAFILYETSSFPDPMVQGAPGAALFPDVLASCLIVLSVILFITGLRRKRESRGRINWKALGKIGLTMILIVVFLIVLDVWDIFILLPLLLTPIMLIMGEKSISAVITVPIIFDLFVYGVFYRIFKVQLPTIYF